METIKLKLRCGVDGSRIIEKKVPRRELREKTMENLLDDYIQTNWEDDGDASEISYIANNTRERGRVFAAYFVEGERIHVYLDEYVQNCINEVERRESKGVFEFCFLKTKIERRAIQDGI